MSLLGSSYLEKLRQWSVASPLMIPFIVGSMTIVVSRSECLWLAVVLILTVALAFLVQARVGLLSVAVLLLYGGVTHSRLGKEEQVLASATSGKSVTVRGVITKVHRGDRATLKTLEGSDLVTGVKVLLDDGRKYQVGDILAGNGWLREPRKPRNPGDFDEIGWFESMGVGAVLRGNFSTQGQSIWYKPMHWFSGMKNLIKRRLAMGIDDPEEVKVIHSMFLGERYGSDDPIILDYRRSGTMHVFAVSGLHVMMVGLIAHWLCRLIQVGCRVWVPIVIFVMAVYAGITGWGTPSVRAVIMAAVFLSGFLVHRKPRLLNSMAASALLVLLLDTHQLYSVGFQLSYFVVLCIVLLSEWWERRLAFIQYIEPFLPRGLYTTWQSVWLSFRKWFTGSLAVSCAAWMGSAPLIGLHFKMCSPVALILGVPMVVGLFSVMVLSCVSLTLGVIHPSVAAPLNKLNGSVAGMSRQLAGWGTDLPGGHQQFTESAKGRIVVFDMKGGAATYLGFGGGVLIDGAGPRQTRDLEKSLTSLNVDLDSFILTHGDIHHCAAVDTIMENYKVKQLLLPSQQIASHPVREKLKGFDASLFRIPSVGDVFWLEGKVSIKVLYNGADQQGVSADDRGLVLMLYWKGFRVLLMGDAGFYTQKKLLDSNQDLRADVIVMGKHSGESLYHAEFYKKIEAKAIVATDYRYHYDEQRSKEWVRQMEMNDAQLLLTSSTGAVSIEYTAGKLILDPYLEGENVVISPSR